MGLDQGQRRHPLGMPVSPGQTGADQEARAVLHQGMAHEAQLRLLAGPLAIEPRVRVGGRRMGRVRALLAPEVRLRVAPAARAGGSSDPSFGRKLFIEAQASISGNEGARFAHARDRRKWVPPPSRLGQERRPTDLPHLCSVKCQLLQEKWLCRTLNAADRRRSLPPSPSSVAFSRLVSRLPYHAGRRARRRNRLRRQRSTRAGQTAAGRRSQLLVVLSGRNRVDETFRSTARGLERRRGAMTVLGGTAD